jgi:energy-coupling factor transporter ATP-binding protein EcfA2
MKSRFTFALYGISLLFAVTAMAEPTMSCHVGTYRLADGSVVDIAPSERDTMRWIDEKSEEPVTVLLGRNGSGKSNLFEALIIIFRDLIQGKMSSDFGYDLRYTLRGGAVSVCVCNPAPARGEVVDVSSHQAFTGKEGEIISAFSFIVIENGDERRVAKTDIRSFLPRYVVTYYSGVSNRMEHHFFAPQLEFRNELLEGNVIPLRPMFYAKPIHSQFALLAFFMTEDKEVAEFLSEYPQHESKEQRFDPKGLELCPRSQGRWVSVYGLYGANYLSPLSENGT